jgi:hypothetical protein
MATVNLNPSSTVSNDWGIIGGAGTAHGVLSDGAAGTYIQTQAQYRACIVELDDYTAGGTISNIRFVVKGFLFNTRSGDTDIQVIIISSEEGAEALYIETVTLNFNSYIVQTHTGTERTTSDGSTAWSDSDLDGLRLVIYTSADPPGASSAVVTEAYIIVTYEAAATGYANDVMGVASGNIGKVINVATANIDKVIGV